MTCSGTALLLLLPHTINSRLPDDQRYPPGAGRAPHFENLWPRYLIRCSVQRSGVYIPAAAEHFNNFENVIKNFVTSINFMADEGNKF
jgi:hypothetical protein